MSPPYIVSIGLYVAGTSVLGLGGVLHILEERNPLQVVNRRRHLTFDLIVIAISTVLVAGLTIWLLDGVLRIWLIEHIELASTILAWPLILRITLALVLGDLGYWVVHRSMHTDLLWRTHVFHHSIQEVYWFSGLRTSAMNSLLIRLPYLVGLCMFGIPPAAVAIVAVSLGAVNFWVHSNVRISLGWLNWIFITPAFHRVHHSMEDSAQGRNFGNILSCWDYLFGTALQPDEAMNQSPKGFAVSGGEATRQLIGL